MSNKTSQLLSATEILDIYHRPILNDIERREYFTFNDEETKALKSFKNTEDAVYFAVCLVFFKIKRVIIDFSYRDITQERQHLMERYLSSKNSPKTLPKDRRVIAKIENKVLKLCSYQRLSDENSELIKKELQQLAPSKPRQRQLCKALLDLFIKHKIAIPGLTTIKDFVVEVWNKENSRVIKSYFRYTYRNQRDAITSLLNKTDENNCIVSIKQEIKSFNTEELRQELEKHDVLKPIFEIARAVLPKLHLPTATVSYYASLINYYNSFRLKEINQYLAQIYLLCYSHRRYQSLNDNLLEVLKKRTLEYKTKAIDYAKEESLKQLEVIKDIRRRTSEMLVAIKNHPNPKHIPREDLYKHIPEGELITVAKMLIDDNFDRDLLFWKHIDRAENSIKINLRKIFLTIDLIVTDNDAL